MEKKKIENKTKQNKTKFWNPFRKNFQQLFSQNCYWIFSFPDWNQMPAKSITEDFEDLMFCVKKNA